MPKEAKASLAKTRQVVHLTGNVHFPSSRLAGGLALQDRGKRFNQRFLNTIRFVSCCQAHSPKDTVFGSSTADMPPAPQRNASPLLHLEVHGRRRSGNQSKHDLKKFTSSRE